MSFTKEQYQEYYQKIKEERNKKRREEYLAQKAKVDEKEKVSKVDENSPSRVDEIVRPATKENIKLFNSGKFQPAKLWSDYYLVKKPTCSSCKQKGIGDDTYRFCSEKLMAPHEYQS